MILADEKRCTGCRTCEMVCTLVHDGDVTPSRARLRVVRDCFVEPTPTVRLCRQCSDAACAAACPAVAIGRDEATAAWVVVKDNCIACGTCAAACAFGMIRLDPRPGRTAYKCDLCGGDPHCVRHCPQAALSCGDREA